MEIPRQEYNVGHEHIGDRIKIPSVMMYFPHLFPTLNSLLLVKGNINNPIHFYL